MKAFFKIMAVLALAFVVSACEEGGIKKELPNSLTKISVQPFENKTGQPNVDQLLTQKTIQDFIADGRLNVVAEKDADAIVRGTLQRYDKIVLTRDANQVPQQYKLQLIVDIDFVDAKTGQQTWTTRRTIDLTPQPENGDKEGAQWDSTNTRSLKEFTTYYVLNTVGVPPEDETTAANRTLDQMANRVVRRVIDGF
jgi:hypothetical protein